MMDKEILLRKEKNKITTFSVKMSARPHYGEGAYGEGLDNSEGIDYKQLVPGDLVYDDIEKRYYPIKKIETGEIYMDDPNSDSDILMTLQDDEVDSGGRWVMDKYPDHPIRFREAPGKTFTGNLTISADTCHNFLLIIDFSASQYHSIGDLSAVFETRQDAVEYFASMFRSVLEKTNLAVSTGFDGALFHLLLSHCGDRYDLSEDPPHEISEIIMSYKEELELDGGICFEKEDEQTLERTRDYINITKIPCFFNSPMVKSSSKQ